jgi:ADP-heptose:LPS heptosyltransferase
MQISTMKAIDCYAGQMLSALLRTHDILTPERREPERIDRILIIKFWGMGSLILAGPVFKTLRKAFPEAQIHLATMGSNREISEMLGLADHLLCLDMANSAPGIALKIMRFFNRVRGIHADAVIDLEYLTRFSAAVSYISGAPIRIGFHSWDVWRGNLHNRQVAFSPYWHVTDNFVNLAQRLTGTEFAEKELDLTVTEQAKKQARDALQKAGIGPDEPVVIVNPNASTMALERRWPEEHFVELIDRMVDSGSSPSTRMGRPVLIGAPEEADFVAGLHQKLASPSQTINLAGRIGLQGLVGLLHRARVLVTNDSGPLHLASLLGTPTISFFGPETPLLYGPLGPNHTVLYKGIECSPCINVYNAKTVRCLKGRPECLYAITVDQAFKALQEKLAGYEV